MKQDKGKAKTKNELKKIRPKTRQNKKWIKMKPDKTKNGLK